MAPDIKATLARAAVIPRALAEEARGPLDSGSLPRMMPAASLSPMERASDMINEFLCLAFLFLPLMATAR